MIKRLFGCLLMIGAFALAQAPPPQNFFAMGAAYNPNTLPQGAGWVSYAHLINEKQKLYWFTTEDITSARTRPFTIQTSIRTGIATPIREIGRFTLMGLVDAGGASSSISTSGAASTGSIGLLRVSKSMYLVGGFRILKIGNLSGTPKLYEAGVGYSW